MSTAPDPAFVALQTALAGRFSLESEIGRGGMGIVYLARDVILERPVAIKLLAPTIAARSEVRRRFLREARIAAQCFHPNIVPIHEVAEQGDLATLHGLLAVGQDPCATFKVRARTPRGDMSPAFSGCCAARGPAPPARPAEPSLEATGPLCGRPGGTCAPRGAA